MDRLDVASSVAIAALLAGAAVIAAGDPDDPRPLPGRVAPAAPAGAEVAAAEHMRLGDERLASQDLPGAVAEYRRAVDLDPDYLDRKTGKFQGRKIRHVVDEALADLERRKAAGEGDAVAEAIRTARYLLRKIAGSCG